MAYSFQLIEKAEATPQSQRHLVQDALKERPFQLFQPTPEEEAAAYVPTKALRAACNVSLLTGRPLLLTGEPGCGKTSAASWIASLLDLQWNRFQVKSNSRAQDLLYVFDNVAYFRESQISAAKPEAKRPEKGDFVSEGPLWKAIEAKQDKPQIVLIDEIDKAPRDFPNDLLHELDRMEIECVERGTTIRQPNQALRPVVVITSNSERRLPEPFLRRCVYHNIVLDEATMTKIIDERIAARAKSFFDAPSSFRNAARSCFIAIRNNPYVQKKPSIDEFWQWFVAVAQSSKADRDRVVAIAGGGNQKDLPLIAALLKTSEDIAQLR